MDQEELTEDGKVFHATLFLRYLQETRIRKTPGLFQCYEKYILLKEW